MFSSLRGISARGRRTIARWTGFGTLFCIAVSVTYNWLAFRHMGAAALRQGIISAIVLPVVLAGPLFFYLTLKLRELAIANHKLRAQASTDGLTNCLNRRAFSRQVEDWLSGGMPDGGEPHGALLVIDADNFKTINDRFGHHEGDMALVKIAAAIRSVLRADDLVGRLGGEEFGVFLPGAATRDAVEIAERICHTVNGTAFSSGDDAVALSVSIGCATFDHVTSFRKLFHLADQRLYEAKSAGRNCVMSVHAGRGKELPLPSPLH